MNHDNIITDCNNIELFSFYLQQYNNIKTVKIPPIVKCKYCSSYTLYSLPVEIQMMILSHLSEKEIINLITTIPHLYQIGVRIIIDKSSDKEIECNHLMERLIQIETLLSMNQT